MLRVILLTCNSSDFALKDGSNEPCDVRPKTHPDQVEGLQFTALVLQEDRTHICLEHCRPCLQFTVFWGYFNKGVPLKEREVHNEYIIMLNGGVILTCDQVVTLCST